MYWLMQVNATFNSPSGLRSPTVRITTFLAARNYQSFEEIMGLTSYLA